MEDKIREETKKERFTIELLDFVRITLICFVLVFLCVKFVVRPVTVEGNSMFPTLKDQEFGFSNIFSTYTSSPERFDVVVVNYEPKNDLWVKRIIGLPGETVEYKNDRLYINGKYVKEDFFDKEYVKSQTNNGQIKFTNDFGPYKLGKDEYFCCGDNRLVSYDSRRVGPFKKDDIVCKYVYVVYPFEEIGAITNGTK